MAPSRLIGPPDPRWDAFAAREPYFAVLTDARFLRANLTPDHERDFFESGEALVDWMFSIIDRRLSPNFAPMSILEYGCGVGRLALPLARRAASVTAVDSSPAMLNAISEEASRRAVDLSVVGVQAFFSAPAKFDLITCVHVLQRLPEPRGLSVLRALVDRIATGGIGVFHVPYATSASMVVRLSRSVREYVPGANRVANLLLGKPGDEPLIPSHTYDLDRVLRLLDEAGISASQIVFEHEPELSSVIVFAERPLPSITGVDEKGRPLPGTRLLAAPLADPPIDVRDLIAGTSIEALNRSAEQYFSSLTDWEDQLAKPFSKPVDTPAILANLATLLHGLRLKPGMTVLEFGAGAGWLSRSLTQLGCHSILMDVAPSALRIARELYARVPVVGDRPSPEFLEFDGRTIHLPDAGVDRILCFDAFHHVPNPDVVIREFGRVLKPGGIAGFAEPGARHSETPMSQFEMRTYAVVENDIDVHAIWRAARESGFARIELALFHGPPFYVSLEEYGDFLAGGQTVERWLTSTRVFLRHVRNFFLFKAGGECADSRTVQGLAASIQASLVPPARAGDPILIDVTVTNVGTARWLPAAAEYGGVRAGAHLYDHAGRLLDFEIHGSPFSAEGRAVEPGETVHARIVLPPQLPGQYRVEIDCVADKVTWFAQVGSKTAAISIDTRNR